MFLLLGCGAGILTDEPGPKPNYVDTAPTDTADTAVTDTATTTVPDTRPSIPEGCGDDVADGAHEECDGADDSACPALCSSACQCPSAPATGHLVLTMVDVWQGDGMFLVSPDGFTMLVDAGDESEYHGYQRAIAESGFTGIDYSVVSHLHADHMGAMDWALEDHPEIGVAWDGGSRYDSSAADEYIEAAGDRRKSLLVGDTLDLGPSTQVEVLHTNIDDFGNENSNSVVLRVTYGDVTMLLGGDCEHETCERAFDPGPIDIYKVHHHGSSDSSGPSFLQQMQPSVAIISVGEGNDYGHPAEETLRALDSIGADVWRTDQDGTIRVDVDGAGWDVTAENR